MNVVGLGGIKSRASTIRDIFEKGGAIVFPDREFFALGISPFFVSSFMEFVNSIRQNFPSVPPPFLYLKEERYISRFFFIKRFEEGMLRIFEGFDGVLFSAVPNLKIPYRKVGIKLVKEDIPKDILEIIGGVLLCVPIRKEIIEPVFSDRLDVIFVKDGSAGNNFPTYVEAVSQDTVRVIYEGKIQRHTLSEFLLPYGLKVM